MLEVHTKEVVDSILSLRLETRQRMWTPRMALVML